LVKTRDFTGAETDMETVQYMRTNLKGLPLVVKLLITLKGEKYWVNIQGQALYNRENEIIKLCN
jgi:hypothetical protein